MSQKRINFPYKPEDTKGVGPKHDIIGLRVTENFGDEKKCVITPIIRTKTFVSNPDGSGDSLIEIINIANTGATVGDEELVRKARLYKALQEELIEFFNGLDLEEIM